MGKVLLSHYIGDRFFLLFSFLVGFRLVHSRDWHWWRVEWDYLPLTGEEALNKFIDKGRAKEYGDRRISEDSKHDTYVALFNSEMYHD